MVSSPFPADAELQKPVCVFCGSSPGSKPIFAQAAESVGRTMAAEKIPLVYGGGRRGIMGVVSKAVLEAGGYSHGIIPRALMERASEKTVVGGSAEGQKSREGQGDQVLDDEYNGRLTTEVTGSMHDRKLRMAQYSTGGFIVLPGGYGTFEELMEMVTWNQLGIHSLPVIVVNVGNFYTPMAALLDGAVSAGFIAPQNLSLLKIVNLEGGDAANADETRVEEWGPAVLKALKEWSLPATAGYGLDWSADLKETGSATPSSTGETAGGQSNDTSTNSQHQPCTKILGSNETPALFSTMRYQTTQMTEVVDLTSIPLLDYHIDRLQTAHAHFSSIQGEAVWGSWVGRKAIERRLEEVLLAECGSSPGDWRVKVIVRPTSVVEVQAVPFPSAGCSFQWHIPATRQGTRTLLIDPIDTDVAAQADAIDYRMYKTTRREIYDGATARAEKVTGMPHQEVLIHTKLNVLETSTANIAIYSPMDGTLGDWVTPRLDSRASPFLAGVVRRHLLSGGIIREGEITMADLSRLKAEKGRIIGFNGLRGIWEYELI